METQTTKNTVNVAEGTKVNLPEVTIESQPRPKVNIDKMVAIKALKDIKIKTNQIIQK